MHSSGKVQRRGYLEVMGLLQMIVFVHSDVFVLVTMIAVLSGDRPDGEVDGRALLLVGLRSRRVVRPQDGVEVETLVVRIRTDLQRVRLGADEAGGEQEVVVGKQRG